MIEKTVIEQTKSVHSIETLVKTLVVVLFILCLHAETQSRNFIRYHQRSLFVQELISECQYTRALSELAKLNSRYGLMPTETFALALCQFETGDTTAAHRSYLRCLEQHGLIIWLLLKPPTLKNYTDSIWYSGVLKEAVAYRKEHPEFIDGPTGSVPTILTRINKLHQHLLDSIATTTNEGVLSEKEVYQIMQHTHDAFLDSLISGKMKRFSVAAYGVNTDLQTFLLHVSPEVMVRKRKHIYRWLKQGLIYPDDYAASVDGPAYRNQRPMKYKFYRTSDDQGVRPGFEKMRWKIGMGNDHLNALRFVRPI